MRVTTTDIPGLLLIEPDVSAIHGGSFLRRTMHVGTRTPAFPVPLFRITVHSPYGARCAGSTIKSRTPRGSSWWRQTEPFTMSWWISERGRRALASGMEPSSRRRIGSKSMCHQVVRMDSA